MANNIVSLLPNVWLMMLFFYPAYVHTSSYPLICVGRPKGFKDNILLMHGIVMCQLFCIVDIQSEVWVCNFIVKNDRVKDILTQCYLEFIDEVFKLWVCIVRQFWFERLFCWFLGCNGVMTSFYNLILFSKPM